MFQQNCIRIENLQNDLFKIKSVKGISPFSIEKKWRFNMQLILTDHGVYYDNICSEGGHNWAEEIGKTVKAYCIKKFGHDFLKYIENPAYSESKGPH